MRLLHADSLEFREFFDEAIPEYAILSHQWNSVEEEVSYADFRSNSKRLTAGFDKILNFCRITSQHGLKYCWIDTCCIDKTSSAELTEAINSMFSWYKRAKVCFAYLRDVSTRSSSSISHSSWFTRGWTLQELIAPHVVEIYDHDWSRIGTRFELRQQICAASGIDEALLAGETDLEEYSAAQIMSWAADRRTSRREDEAYCLLGLFGVNLPLLYGEGHGAFRRLQEEMLMKGDDNSLFAWGDPGAKDSLVAWQPSVLAPSPKSFRSCGEIKKGFATQRILFEATNRGIMVLIHRSYDRQTLDQLLSLASGNHVYEHVYDKDTPPGLSIPLGCYQKREHPDLVNAFITEAFFLQLVHCGGKWRRVGVEKHFEKYSQVEYKGNHYAAYANDYVRIYIHDDHRKPYDPDSAADKESLLRFVRPIHYLHLRDGFHNTMESRAWEQGRPLPPESQMKYSRFW